MHRRTPGFIILLALLLAVSTMALGQKNEVSISAGAVATSDQTLTVPGVACLTGNPNCATINTSTSTGVAFAGVYSRQLFSLGRGASLGLEIPLVGVPERDVLPSSGGLAGPAFSQSALFFTPSARIRFLASSPVSPFLSLGGGLAHHDAGSGSINRGALQFGGGLDFKTPLPHLALRAELRDFWAGGLDESDSTIRVSPERQHNVFAGGGIVLRF